MNGSGQIDQLEDRVRSMILGNSTAVPSLEKDTIVAPGQRNQGHVGPGPWGVQHHELPSHRSDQTSQASRKHVQRGGQSLHQRSSGFQRHAGNKSHPQSQNDQVLQHHHGRGGHQSTAAPYQQSAILTNSRLPRGPQAQGGHSQGLMSNTSHPQSPSHHNVRYQGQTPRSQHPQADNSQSLSQYPGQRRRGFRSSGPQFTSLFNPHQQSAADQTNAQCDFLEKLAASWLPQLEMGDDELKIKDLFRLHLQEACQQAVKAAYGVDAPKLGLEAFGSFSSGFAMPSSDMDLALLVSHMPDGMPRVLEKTLLDLGHGARLLSRTRVPIIKVCERPAPELYAALRAEREKWDSMTLEERDRYDQTGRQEDDIEKEKENGQGTDHDVEHDPNANNGDAPPAHTINTNGKKKQLAHAELTVVQDDNEDQAVSINENKRLYGTEDITINTTNSIAPTTILTQNDLPGNSKVPRPKRRWYREKRPSPLDFPKTGVGIQCDINFSNPLGLHNTLLLRCYSHCDVRVRLMVLLVKAWAGRRKINSGYNGTLSSYGYVLMVLHYLVNVAQPPVCPNLQIAARRSANGSSAAWNPDPADPNAVCEGWDVRFWRNEQEILRSAARGMVTRNQDPLGVLLRGFFHYYAHQGYDVPLSGFVWTMQVLSLRTPGGTMTKEAKGWTGAKTTMQDKKEIRHRFLFAIEDPFELSHNVARTVTHNGIVAIRDEFRRAWRILGQIGRGRTPEGDLFAQLEDVAPAADEQHGLIEATGEKELDETALDARVGPTGEEMATTGDA